MITLKGKLNEYFFDASKPLKKPGKFSVVYKAKNSEGASILIKQLSVDSSINSYETLIEHPCFVKSIEQIESDGNIYLIRPFIDGVGLNELKVTNWFASEKKVLFLKRIIIELSEALASLHAQKMVHLDIRPHNIIINTSSESVESIVSIIDLDTARPFYSSEKIKFFPLIYAAPEMLLKKNSIIDNRTDIYALAVTIYELIFNKIPFSNYNAEYVMHLMLNKKLEYTSKRTNPIVDIINKAANKQAFNLPPNNLDNQQVEELLLLGMNSRYSNIESFSSDILNAINYEKNWLNRLTQFFQR